ncbi:hypothetical protein LGQ03_15780 [Loktanella sp. TSTF-M6]|uniref:Uncharacterized protein n=1 Tax=Loktanella gaetbuli TaxID=2881335 RepID=A0ABS8BY76_9RHOB|nr:hypothetical protein [Loktanella gaetbuli]MCB5200697.1 hypothetical protein [Loktanella gaetbuli]
MDTIAQNLSSWRASLMPSIPIAGLLSRNPIVYKWKAPFRCWLLREAAFWRVTDLLTQSYALHQQGHGLGARILLRSGIETLASLIYLNQLIEQVLVSKLDFHEFGQMTKILSLGSRDGSTKHQSRNIVTILKKCNKRYPGIENLYGILSESAHPNYYGLVAGYSEVNHDEYETCFSNRWMEINGASHLDSIELCMMTFHHEYNDVWPNLMDKFENWIAENTDRLEATKNTPA